MLVYVYKSSKKEGTYLYLTKRDDFSSVPSQLKEVFGTPIFVMIVNLAKRDLATVDVEKVKQSLESEGFFLQLPPPPENLLDKHKEWKKTQRDS
ncbi:YcgL domain-containing protein [Vibrio sp. SCSIO 43136]|uniref:YcgL domain-containing protein n=1 Tax=Vibrio sp. SCSIO 43136 TaxID=2819101 RepID=UPI002075442F|nr:YcgL domain-containing protein [Vibrio sp. SCSIO 43136]USD64516.1 YcgL domain-containing protein [Vibrio sp. SCSIO 43136]